MIVEVLAQMRRDCEAELRFGHIPIKTDEGTDMARLSSR